MGSVCVYVFVVVVVVVTVVSVAMSDFYHRALSAILSRFYFAKKSKHTHNEQMKKNTEFSKGLSHCIAGRRHIPIWNAFKEYPVKYA